MPKSRKIENSELVPLETVHDLRTRFLTGFTLVELMVTISIVSVILSIVLYNYGTFNDNIALSSSGQEMAIAIRQAQTYGVNVREVKVGGGVFSTAYGIYFNPSSNPSDYYVFADTNGNKVYDVGNGCGGAVTECIEKFTLRNGVKISQICDGASNCPPAPGQNVTNLDITFLRPNLDANINFANSVGNIKATTLTGKIVLISPKNKTLTIAVENTGQVLAQ